MPLQGAGALEAPWMVYVDQMADRTTTPYPNTRADWAKPLGIIKGITQHLRYLVSSVQLWREAQSKVGEKAHENACSVIWDQD